MRAAWIAVGSELLGTERLDTNGLRVTALLVLWAACATVFSLVAWTRLARRSNLLARHNPPVLLLRPADAGEDGKPQTNTLGAK